MPLFENHVGIQLEKEKLRLVEIIYKNDEFLLENVAEEKFEKKFEADSDVSYLGDILQNSFQKIISIKPLNSKFLSATFDLSFFNVFEIPFDNTLLKNDLNEHLYWELQKLFPYEKSEDFLLQNVEYKSEFINRKNYTGVFAVRKKLLHVLSSFAKKNNMTVKFVDHPHTASNSFLKLANKEIKNLLGLTLFLAKDNISVMVLADTAPIWIKQKKLAADDSVENVLKNILQDLFNYDIDLTNLGFAYVAGDDISEELVSNISDSFGMKIIPVNPFEKLKISPDFQPNEYYRKSPFAFTAPAGLATRLI